MAEKVTLKLGPAGLHSLGNFIGQVLAELDRNDDWDQLLGYILAALLKKKIAPKLVFPAKENSLQLKQEEAKAIKIACTKVDLVDMEDYTAAVMIDISNKLR